MMNGDNNKKIISQRTNQNDSGKWMKDYISAGWIIVRGAWFFDYLKAVLQRLCYRPDMECSKVAVEAYDEALARHHPWFLRKGAKMGMMLATSRKNFINGLVEEQQKVTSPSYNEEKLIQDLKILYDYMQHLSKHLWHFFKSRNLEEIP